MPFLPQMACVAGCRLSGSTLLLAVVVVGEVCVGQEQVSAQQSGQSCTRAPGSPEWPTGSRTCITSQRAAVLLPALYPASFPLPLSLPFSHSNLTSWLLPSRFNQLLSPPAHLCIAGREKRGGGCVCSQDTSRGRAQGVAGGAGGGGWAGGCRGRGGGRG